MTIQQSLKSINAYPIPQLTIQEIAETRGLTISVEATADERKKDAYRLAKADLFKWLSKAPNVSQAGITYSFSEAERRRMESQANSIYKDCGEVDGSLTTFGYMGELF